MPSALLVAPLLALLAACGPDPARDADTLALAAALRPPLPLARGGATWQGPVTTRDGVQARAVALPLDAGPHPWLLAALLLEPQAPTDAGVLVAHGHYGDGKRDPNALEIAWRLARSGARVLVLDNPGVEEWDVPGRQLHLTAGAHGRAWLAAAGTSALALQVAALGRGLDLLEERGARRLAATGASGGAVLSFYLGRIDPRIRAVALAAVPPIPREARAAGCPCDQLPGRPGPDPTLLAGFGPKMLWLSDVEQPRPAGLPRGARFEVLAGEHAYSEPMQARALAFLADHLPLRSLPQDADGGLPAVPQLELRTPGAAGDPAAPALWELPWAPAPATWTPQPDLDAPYQVDCQGQGPVVLALGATPDEVEALAQAGLSPCALHLREDPVSLAEAISAGRAPADRPAGAVLRAARQRGARGIYAVRGWAMPALVTDLPVVVRQPVRRPDQVDLARDPAWIHVPGAWWGEVDRRLGAALATGEEVAPLVDALARAIDPGAAARGPP